MEENSNKKGSMKKAIITTIISGIFAIICAIIGVQAGEKKAISDLQNSVGEISGDNATVTINDVDDFVKEYEDTKISNNRYAEQLEDTTNELKESKKEVKQLKEQLGNTPVFKFQDLGLEIEGDEISLDSKNAMVTIDGRRYLAEEFLENSLASDQSLTIKSDKAYIGKIIKDKTNIIDKWVMDSREFGTPDSATDSYGNVYSNAIMFYSSGGYVIYNLNKEYSLFKCEISMDEDVNIDAKGKITIKADDKVVYTSPILQKKGETVSVKDVAIKNCSLLTIEYDVDRNYCACIVSDASVYN